MSGRRFRRWHRMKWVGLAACLALIAACIATGKISSKNMNAEVWFHNSVIFFYQPVGPGVESEDWDTWKVGILNNPGMLPKYGRIKVMAGELMYMSLPPQLPFFFIVIATSVLWRLLPRYPSGYCSKCGYDLTGNESGTCPECGATVAL